jgi:hypothetical protein
MISPSLPTAAHLQPLLDKLEANPGSVILIALDQPEACNFARVTSAWFSPEERNALKAALARVRKRQGSHQIPPQ